MRPLRLLAVVVLVCTRGGALLAPAARAPAFEGGLDKEAPRTAPAVAGEGKADRAAVGAAFAHAEGLRKRGRLAEAAAAYDGAVRLAQEAFGPEHWETATLMNSVAELYEDQGWYAKAEALFRRSLEIREKVFGKQHPSVAQSLNNLGLLYGAQAQYGKAEPFLQRSLAIWESRVGKDHPDVATCLNNLGELYREQGQYGKAEPLHQRSLAIRERQLGKQHPDVALSLNNLALLYQALGQPGKAEPLLQRSLGIWEKRLGKDHPDVANALNNLALLYRGQARYGKAEPLYRRSLEIYEKRLGKDHPDVATSLNNLALLYEVQGQYGKAEPLFLRSLEIREKRLGKDHPDVGNSLNTLAGLYLEQRQYGKAELLLQRGLVIWEKQLGKDHPHVANNLNTLAGLYAEQGEYGKAEPLLVRSLEIREKRLGKDHPDVAGSLNNLAALYRHQGQDARAEPLLVRGVEIYERQLGEDHPDAATVFNNLAALHAAAKRWRAATEVFDRARRGLRRHLTRELATLPDLDQLTFLRTQANTGFHMALSLAWLQRTEAVARRPSAAWLINGQALAHEALAAQTLLARDSAGQPWAPLAVELQDVRRQLAALAVQPAPPQRLAAHRRLLAELNEREQALAQRVARESGRGERAAPGLELEQVQKRLGAGTALVAIARFHVFDFRGVGREKRWGPPRYAAWVIDAATVHIVDLGEAAALEREVRTLRQALAGGTAAAAIKNEGEPDAEKLLRVNLDKVSGRVLHPLLPYLKDRPRWLVCPDGALWLVPWAALTLPDGKYVVEKYYTPEQLAEFKEKAREYGEDKIRAAEAEWLDLIAQVRAHMQQGTDPASEPVRRLARRQAELIQAFHAATGNKPEIQQAVQKMWQEEENIQGIDTKEMRAMSEYLARGSAADQKPQ